MSFDYQNSSDFYFVIGIPRVIPWKKGEKFFSISEAFNTGYQVIDHEDFKSENQEFVPKFPKNCKKSKSLEYKCIEQPVLIRKAM